MTAPGLRTLADSNIEMLSGMSQIATQLQNSSRAAADSDSSSDREAAGSPGSTPTSDWTWIGVALPCRSMRRS